jgi:hypothetical protein
VSTGSGAGIAEGGWGKPTSHSVSIGAIEGEAEAEDLDLSIADSEDEHSPVGEFLSCELPSLYLISHTLFASFECAINVLSRR